MLAAAVACAATAATDRKNVLFFAVDDLRPDLTCYGDDPVPGTNTPAMHTPNFDRLAKRSLVGLRNYCQQAVCGPTRASIMTGRRPDRTRTYDLYSYFRTVAANYTTIPEYFLHQGYYTIGMGKIFHPGHASGSDDVCCSWTNKTGYWHAPNLKTYSGYSGGVTNGSSWFAVPEATEKKAALPDTQTAQNAVATLAQMPKTLKEGQNFFLAVGFHKPHLPFVFPERLLSLYPQNDIKLPPNQQPPKNMPDLAWSNYGELRHYSDIDALHASGAAGTVLPKNDVLELRRAYYSAVSHTDENLGLVLDALDSSPYANNTVISLWGDHGWQLGEHGEWCKHTNFEFAARAPMFVSVPGLTDGGMKTTQYTEHVDLYPTLVEAALGKTLERCPDGDASFDVLTCTEGESLVPLMSNPSKNTPSWSFSQYPRGYHKGDEEVEEDAVLFGLEATPSTSACIKSSTKCTMGYTVAGMFEKGGAEYRYTMWCDFNTAGHKLHADPTHCPYTELYNHTADPGENFNIAAEASSASVVKMIAPLLTDYMKGKW